MARRSIFEGYDDLLFINLDSKLVSIGKAAVEALLTHGYAMAQTNLQGATPATGTELPCEMGPDTREYLMSECGDQAAKELGLGLLSVALDPWEYDFENRFSNQPKPFSK